MPDGRSYDPGGFRPASGRPAEPYEQGNVASITSGAHSPRVHHRFGNFLVAGLLAERPDLAAYPESVSAWGRSEARVLLLHQHLQKLGIADEQDNLRTALLDRLNAAESRAEKARALLGLDPMSEAKLAQTRASASVLGVDLLALAEKGRLALAEREAGERRAAELVPDPLLGEGLP